MKNKISVGFYLGVGDFLCAVPIFNELLKENDQLRLYVSRPILAFVPFLELDCDKIEFVVFDTLRTATFSKMLGLVSALKADSSDMFLITPDAQRGVSSWKIPLILRAAKVLLRKEFKIVGAAEDRLSRLYDLQVPVSKRIDLTSRGFSLAYMARIFPTNRSGDGRIFKYSTLPQAPVYDLVIHPGASKDHKKWPLSHYCTLIRELGANFKIAFIGTDNDLRETRMCSDIVGVNFVVDSLGSALAVVRNARCVLTMDSGFSHVAALMQRPHVALFGPTSTEATPPASPFSRILSTECLSCRPCNLHYCRFTENYCMHMLEPKVVGKIIYEQLDHGK